ncbi:cytochrome P450 [Mycena pura]|uniref:Cytochrome P450 n=1 Tax=Mycena pura TaxID=153505 RepID=A0AAD6VBE7_9AGAR|nr:cytochrome P450 [Mycena pura]
MAVLVWTLTFLVLVAICVKFLCIGLRAQKYPLGPATLPVIGNLHVFPKRKDMHAQFAAWGKQYGGVFSVIWIRGRAGCSLRKLYGHLKVFSHTIVVVSKATAVREIIDKSGWISSSRPRNTLARWTLGDKFFVFAPLGPQQLAARKATETFLLKQSVALDSQTAAESTQLLYELLESPSTAVYGTRAPSFTAPNVTKYYEEIDAANTALSPGTYPPIDLIPFLKYLPSFLAPWRRHCAKLFESRCARLKEWYDRGMWLRTQNGSTGQSGTFIDWAHKFESTLDHDWILCEALSLLERDFPLACRNGLRHLAEFEFAGTGVAGLGMGVIWLAPFHTVYIHYSIKNLVSLCGPS